MARKALVSKSARMRRKYYESVANGTEFKFKTRVYNRCLRCGRPRGYIRDFGMCRICLNELAREGAIPGLRKSSW